MTPPKPSTAPKGQLLEPKRHGRTDSESLESQPVNLVVFGKLREVDSVSDANTNQHSKEKNKFLLKEDEYSVKEISDDSRAVTEERSEPVSTEEEKQSLYSTFKTASSPKELGALLAAARRRANMTQTQVAKCMGTDHRAVRRLEKGDANPTMTTIGKYAEAIGVTIGIGLTSEHE